MTSRRFRSAGLHAFALAIGLALFLPPAPVAAQGFFGGVAGQDCRALQEQGGSYWQGFVRGREESPFLSDDGLYERAVRHCFRTRAECDAWLYDMQSALVTVSRTWCRPHG